jgi:outer membrane protein assembly factor BamB
MHLLRRVLVITGALLVVSFAVGVVAGAGGGHSPSSAALASGAARAKLPTFRERWRLPIDAPFVGLPAVDADGVVATAGESQVIATDRDGKLRWSTALDGALANAPRLDRELVLVAGARVVAALRRDTGQVAWAFRTVAAGAEEDRANRPVVVGDTVVASTASGRVIGLDRVTGALRWDVFGLTASTAEPAAWAGGVVVVGVGEWRALDPASGATLWSGDLGVFGTSSPVVFADGDAVLAAVATDGKIVAVNAATGELAWETPAEQSELFQVPALDAESELIVPDHWGRLAAFDVHTGRRLWKVTGPDAVAEFGEPAVLGHRVVALALDDGGPRVASPTASASMPTPTDGHGVALLGADQVVVSTWGDGTNYLVAYDVRMPNR